MSSAESEWEELEKRDSMLESLLILLNSAATLGFGPNPVAFSSEPRPFTSEFPGKKFAKELNEISSSAKNSTSVSHYQLVKKKRKLNIVFEIRFFVTSMI